MVSSMGTALVTGASSGIGAVYADRLARRGYDLVLVARDAARLEGVRERLSGTGRAVETVAADLAAQAGRQRVEDRLRSDEAITMLVNNAGLGGSAPLVEMTDEQWKLVLDVTLTGTFRMMRAMLPHMMARNGGIIVNNASVLGWRAQKLQAHYAAAKAGVMALTRCAAVEAAEHNIRINAVSPSLAMHEFLNRVTSDELLAQLTSREAYGRAAETWEIANVIIFLASEYATYMTGEVVSVSSQRA